MLPFEQSSALTHTPREEARSYLPVPPLGHLFDAFGWHRMLEPVIVDLTNAFAAYQPRIRG